MEKIEKKLNSTTKEQDLKSENGWGLSVGVSGVVSSKLKHNKTKKSSVSFSKKLDLAFGVGFELNGKSVF